MNYFDAHAHLQLEQFDTDRAAVLSRMEDSGVGAIIIGVDLKTSGEAVQLAESRDFLWAAVGLHPNDNPSEVFDMEAFTELAHHDRVVAIGECGLDYFRNQTTEDEKERQKIRFESQITLAVLVKKPLIIHCRDAHDDMLMILKEAKQAHEDHLSIIIHFCTVSGDIARKYVDLGCYLSFPGPVTYTDMYDDSIRLCPLDKILIETDAPFAAPVPYRGKRNEPVYVKEILKKVAQLKGLTDEEMGAQVLQNAKLVFSI